MSDTIIHHINVSYDESDPRVTAFVKQLQHSPPADMEACYKKSLSEKGGKFYVSDREGNEFTVVSSEGHNCRIYLRGTESV